MNRGGGGGGDARMVQVGWQFELIRFHLEFIECSNGRLALYTCRDGICQQIQVDWQFELIRFHISVSLSRIY